MADYAIHADAVAISLSKGLGAPAGSVLAGDASFIQEARRLKTLFGGASPRSGVMAAAGLVALDEGPRRLVSDHQNAQRLAAGVAEMLPGSVAPEDVATNVVLVDVSDTGHPPSAWVDRLVLQRHSGEWVSAASIVGEAGLVLAAAAPSGPGPDVIGAVVAGEDECDE